MRRRPFGAFDFRAAEVFDESNVAGGVATDDVLIAIAVPIETDRRGQRAKLHLICLLLKINRRQKLRLAVAHLARVFHERHTAVFIANDQIDVAIAIPIHRAGQDHFQLHRQHLAAMPELAAGGIFGRLARASIFKIGKAVDKLATEQIEIAVAIKVREVG